MNIIDYLTHHTVARPDLAEKLWQMQRVHTIAADGTPRHPRLDEAITGQVTLDGRLIEETGTGLPLDEDNARKIVSTHSSEFAEGPTAYVLESWIVERMNPTKYGGQAPTLVTFDYAKLKEKWRRIASKSGKREEAMIETEGFARFYTISESGPIYLVRRSPADGGEWAVRRHNLFALTPELEAYLTEGTAPVGKTFI
jgi:hypothetical protein